MRSVPNAAPNVAMIEARVALTEKRASSQARRFARSARADCVTDREFDQIYPDWVRGLSAQHWTPIEVARRAAELLVTSADTRVLDVGAGVGKFCLVGAMTTAAQFTGVEQRANLVDIANEVARRCELPRARFVHANLMAFDWSTFDAFYFFNPFGENLALPSRCIDLQIQRSANHRDRYIAFTRARLAGAAVGTRVVTYHGFGGDLPEGYRSVRRELAGTDYVELWVKETGGPPRIGPKRARGGTRNSCANRDAA